ncbi:MAG: glycyl-radical enzyme activating protein [Oscillospiraceae bacterium]|nr:glycyl-radical enzyme activating protein [Oscillospiraceae bacterium]
MDYRQITGTVFNIQRYSIDDGPGVRTTVFVKGCPLKCAWCSNPESQSFAPQLSYRYTSCKRCGQCIDKCPQGTLSMGENGLEIDRSKCISCGTCTKKCLFGALSISGKSMTAVEAFNVVNRDKDYYEGIGGCTCSGGEILSQPDFVAAVFRLCRENGIHTNADTSGFGSREALKKIMEYADMFYYDMKILDSDLHKKWTAVGNEIILDNLRYVVQSGIPVVIRIPLIPGINATENDIHDFARTVSEYAPSALVSMLSYHEYGKNKYRMIGQEYLMPETPSMTEEEKENALRIVSSYGLQCKIS